MRVFQIILAVVTALLLFSTLVCGLWLKYAGSAVTDRASSIQFHTGIGIAAVVFAFMTIITLFVTK